jgi:hypothetical protein
LARRSITAAATAATTATAAATTAAAVSTTAAATTTTTAVTTTTAATTPAFLGLGFVDSESTAIVFLAVDSRDGCLRFGIAAHFDKSEALASAGVTVSDDLSALHGSVRGKKLFQCGAIDIVAHISNVQFLAHNMFLLNRGGDPRFTFQVGRKEASVLAQKVESE